MSDVANTLLDQANPKKQNQYKQAHGEIVGNALGRWYATW